MTTFAWSKGELCHKKILVEGEYIKRFNSVMLLGIRTIRYLHACFCLERWLTTTRVWASLQLARKRLHVTTDLLMKDNALTKSVASLTFACVVMAKVTVVSTVPD